MQSNKLAYTAINIVSIKPFRLLFKLSIHFTFKITLDLGIISNNLGKTLE